MSNTVKLLLLVVAAGLFAVLARTLYLNAASNTPAPVETSKMIRVTAADLPEGLLLRETDFGWRAVADGDVPNGAIVKGIDGPELKGALLRHPIAKGAVIVTADVIPANDPGFLAATLKPDMRAVSVAIDDVSGNAGLIQPGDFVDLLLTQQLDRQDASRDMSITSETVAQRVRVLAVGSQFHRPTGNNTVDSEPRATARTVTLEVTPHRAEVIAVASKLGSLSLALRSFARTTVVNAASDAVEDAPPPVYAGDITHTARVQRASAPAPAEVVRAAPVEAPVQVFRGSEKTAVSSEQAGAWSAGVPPLPPIPTAMALPGATKQIVATPPAGKPAATMKPIAQQYVDGVPVAQ